MLRLWNSMQSTMFNLTLYNVLQLRLYLGRLFHSPHGSRTAVIPVSVCFPMTPFCVDDQAHHPLDRLLTTNTLLPSNGTSFAPLLSSSLTSCLRSSRAAPAQQPLPLLPSHSLHALRQTLVPHDVSFRAQELCRPRLTLWSTSYTRVLPVAHGCGRIT